MRRRGLLGGLVSVAVVVGALGGGASTEPAAAQAAPPDHVLIDVLPGGFYETAVRWLHGAGHTTGVRPGWFGPDLSITRAELMTLMWRIEGQPAAPPSSFPDVPRNSFFAAAVDWAVHTGLTTGYGQTGTYQPHATVDRAQLVTMLWRSHGSPGAPPAPLVDVARPSYYAAAVDWAHSTGLTTGVGGSNQFRPHDLLARGQAATFLWRDAGQPTAVAPALPPYGSASATVTAADLPTSWRAGCPVPVSDLRRLTVLHIGFDGRPTTGEIVVHSWQAPAVDAAFRHMYDARFPIQRVASVEAAGGNDDAAMAANLTTAFNCRAVTGGSGWSEHADGSAIDINPVQNPYISRSGQVLPPAGTPYVNRGQFVPGLITEGSAPVVAFDAQGWGWGGRWRSPVDYQHFSASGR